MNKALEHYQCDGQISIFDYMAQMQKDKVLDIEIKGFMDDAYCPKCDYAFKTWSGEVDIDCPVCKQKIDWRRYHIMND